MVKVLVVNILQVMVVLVVVDQVVVMVEEGTEEAVAETEEGRRG